jgi:hypothetical protein
MTSIIPTIRRQLSRRASFGSDRVQVLQEEEEAVVDEVPSHIEACRWDAGHSSCNVRIYDIAGHSTAVDVTASALSAPKQGPPVGPSKKNRNDALLNAVGEKVISASEMKGTHKLTYRVLGKSGEAARQASKELVVGLVSDGTSGKKASNKAVRGWGIHPADGTLAATPDIWQNRPGSIPWSAQNDTKMSAATISAERAPPRARVSATRRIARCSLQALTRASPDAVTADSLDGALVEVRFNLGMGRLSFRVDSQLMLDANFR